MENKEKPTMKTIRQLIENWKNYNTTVRELGSLDNRALADLGITRSDIRALARNRLPIY